EPWTDPDILSETVARYRGEGRAAAEIDSLWAQQDIGGGRGAGLLVRGAQDSAEEYRTRVGWGHASFDYSLLVARQSAARQLAFFHHEPMHSDHQIEAMVEEALGSEAHRKH